jgi:hypothetical protein
MPTRSSDIVTVVLLMVCSIVRLGAQEAAQEAAPELVPEQAKSRPRHFVVQAGGGAALSIGPEQTVPEGATESRFGPSFTGRLLWRPGHLLGIGVQSGLTSISRLTAASPGEPLVLTTVPAMLVFSMAAHGFDAAIATGWHRYIVTTEGRTVSSAWELSYVVSAGYTYPLTDAFGIGAEAAFGALPERETNYVSLQLRATYAIEY